MTTKRGLMPPYEGYEFRLDGETKVYVNDELQLILHAGDVLTVRDDTPPRECPDNGWCHHSCEPWFCFRVNCCGPLSDVYPNDEWPEITQAVYGIRHDRGSVFTIDATDKHGFTPVHPAMPWVTISFLMNYGQSRVVRGGR